MLVDVNDSGCVENGETVLAGSAVIVVWKVDVLVCRIGACNDVTLELLRCLNLGTFSCDRLLIDILLLLSSFALLGMLERVVLVGSSSADDFAGLGPGYDIAVSGAGRCKEGVVVVAVGLWTVFDTSGLRIAGSVLGLSCDMFPWPSLFIGTFRPGTKYVDLGLAIRLDVGVLSSSARKNFASSLIAEEALPPEIRLPLAIGSCDN